MGKILLPGISSSQLSTLVLDKKELVYNVDDNIIYYGDGTATGGLSLGGGGGTFSALNVSAGTQSSNLSNLVFSNSNGITFGLSNNTITASHNGLTTAMASNAGSNFLYTSAGLHLTNISATISSNGLSLSVSNQTQLPIATNVRDVGFHGSTGTAISYAPADHVHAGIGQIAAGSNTGNTLGDTVGKHGTWVFAGTNGLTVSGSTNTNGVHTAWLSVNSQSVQPALGTHTALTANGVSMTANTDGLSLNFPAFLTTAQPVGAYLTTAMLSNAVTLSNIKISAGTLSSNRSDFSFNNSNGISFGLNTDGVFTATVKTDYQASGNYLTTAAQSNQVVNSLNGSTGQVSLNVGSSLSASTNGSSITFGLASNITTALQSAGAYLTTAMQSNAVTLSNIRVSAGTTSNLLSALTFNNSNGVSFGINGSVITASHNAITTAAQSNQVVNSVNGSTGQISFNVGSSLSASSNGSTITFGLASNITTALQSAGAYLTTARASNDAIGLNSALTANGVSVTANSSGLSLNFPAFLTTAQPVGAYLTTARASNDGIGLNAAQSNVTWTVNSSGLSINAAGYAGTATTFNGANISASITFNSLGLNMSLSANSGGGSINISAGTSSSNLQSLKFNDINGVSFGLDGGTLTASHNGITSQSNQNISLYALGNTTQNSSTVLNASNLSFNGLGGLSVGFSNGSINLSQSGGGGGLTNINVSAGTTSNLLSALTFADGNNISFGINSATITASYQEPLNSYYDNGLAYQGTTAFTMGGSSNYVQPFLLPYPISASFIRIANSFAFGSTTAATTANISLTLNNSQSVWVNIYSKGVGANASSLQYITRGSVSFVHQVQVSIGAASNNQTIYHNITYPSVRGAAQANFATNYNVNSSNFNISTTHLTSFNGSRWLDIPFAASLPAGNYWMAIAQSTATATTGGVAAMTNVTARNTFVAISQVNANIAQMGVSSNMSTAGMRNGLGYWSTNAIGSSSSSLGLTGISSVANQPLLPFQIIREA
jgi:hypothetical protein